MEKYSDKFKTAVSKTKELGLNLECKFHAYEQRYSCENVAESAIRLFNRRGYSAKNLSQNCAKIHAEVYYLLKSHNENIYLTIGNVVINRRPWLKTSSTILESELKKGPISSEMNMHVWLTFPDMAILDLTIGHNIDLNRGFERRLEDSLIYCPPDEHDELHYYEPMLVGNEYLEKIGAYEVRGQC